MDNFPGNHEEFTGCRWRHGIWSYGLIFTLPVHLGMVLAGVQYGDPKYCRIEIVPQFLQIGGGIMVVLNTLQLFSTCHKKYSVPFACW